MNVCKLLGALFLGGHLWVGLSAGQVSQANEPPLTATSLQTNPQAISPVPTNLASPNLASPNPASPTPASSTAATTTLCRNLNLGQFIMSGSTAILVTPLHEITFTPHSNHEQTSIILGLVAPVELSPGCQASPENTYVQATLEAHESGFYIQMQSLIVAGHFIDLPARSDWMSFDRIPDPQGRTDSAAICGLLDPFSMGLANSYSGESSFGLQMTSAALSTVCSVATGQTAYTEQAVLVPEMLFGLRLGQQGEGSLQTACVPYAMRMVTHTGSSVCSPNGLVVTQPAELTAPVPTENLDGARIAKKSSRD